MANMKAAIAIYDDDLESSPFNDVQAHLAWVRCLQLHLNPVQLPPEPVFRACVKHLTPHPGRVW